MSSDSTNAATASAWTQRLTGSWTKQQARDESSNAPSPKAGVLVLRQQTDCFVVQRQRLLAVHLSANPSASLAFKTIHALALQFDPRGAVLNPSGRLLAVFGDHQVVVVVLPSAAHIKSGTWSEMTATTIKVGEYHHATDTLRRVADLQWHPLSKEFAHLVVLSSEGCLRMYNISTNPRNPELTLHFNPELAQNQNHHRRTTGTFGLDPSVEREAIAFCFGKNDSWGKMTAFGLMKSGEIFALCPILPSHSILAKSTLDQLYRDAVALVSNSNESDPSRTMQVQYLEMIQQRASAVSPRSPLLNIAYHPSQFAPALPLALDSSALFYDEEGGALEEDYSDIVLIHSDGIEVLAIGCERGIVDFFGVFDAVHPFWGPLDRDFTIPADFGNDDEENESILAGMDDLPAVPALLALESVQLGRKTGPIRFLAANDDNCILYAFHNAGVHSVDPSPWLSRLAKLLTQESSNELGQQLMDLFQQDASDTESGVWSDVHGVIDTMPFADSPSCAVEGVALVRDPLLGDHFLALTESNHLVSVDQTRLRIQTRTSVDTSGPSRVSDKLALADSEMDPTLLTSLLDELPISKVLPFIQRSPDGIININHPIPNSGQVVTKMGQQNTKYPSDVTKEAVAQLHSYASKIRENVKTVLQLLVATNTRMDCFESEIQRESQLRTYIEGVLQSSGGVDLQPRIDACVQNMDRLGKRMDVILQICMEAYSPDLSEYEKKWAQEVLEMQKQLQSIVGRAKKLKNQMTLLHRDYEISIANKSHNGAGVGQHQLRQLGRLVEQESKFIEDIRLRLRDVELKLDTIDE